MAGKADPTGSDRRQEQDRGKPLAGKSTLNRLEWGTVKQDRYRKIILDPEAVDRFFVDVFLAPIGRLRQRSCWIWTLPTILCMASRKVVSSMATTVGTVIFPCTFFAVLTCCAPVCGRPMSMHPSVRSASSSASCRGFARGGLRCASSYVEIRGLRVKS